VPPNRLRRLRPGKVDELAESISVIGQRQPIEVQRCGDGYALITGWHRLEAVKKLGNADIHAFILDGIEADEAALIEIDENLIRADLSPAERALHQHRRKALYEKLHPQTKHGASGKGRPKSRQLGDSNRFTKDAAQKTGKSERSIQREVERAAKIPGLADVVGTALDTGDQLDALAKLPELQQRNLIDRAKAGEKLDVKVAVINQRRKEKAAALAKTTRELPVGQRRWPILLADPPWGYQDVGIATPNRRADNHYPLLSLQQICALPVGQLLADDAIVFLWAISPLLLATNEVFSAWGLDYRANLVWDKEIIGTGYWVRNQHEHLLIAVKGNPPHPPHAVVPASVIRSRRREHSRKPDEVHELIERMYPELPKLELFARKARPGWDVWGNEVTP
jgi:N6-adenosine-specific RNA methylase IME4/ParB-like chromosome segregation protein Spo0J